MKRKFIIVTFIILIITFIIYDNITTNKLPMVAIASYGPHSSLNAAIDGFKLQMHAEGFIENQNISYEIADTGFDPSLIPQMLLSLKAKKPQVMMVMTTPVAQLAKGKIHDIPLIFNAVTDPQEAGLIKNMNEADGNMTGSSDMQNLDDFLEFAKSILPKAKKIGLLYATSESNDTALVNMMRKSAAKFAMEIVAIPIEQARDVYIRVQDFKDKVDLIYVGTSGPIQPTLPTIFAEAKKMHIPVFNADSQAVKDGLALASFSVDYIAVGKNAAKLAAAIIHGQKVSTLPPLYPTRNDHFGLINKKLAAEFNINVPANIEVVE
jgi:putative ABC transport system substrate-binding protein